MRVIRLARILRALRSERFGNMGSVIADILKHSAAALAIPIYFMMLALVRERRFRFRFMNPLCSHEALAARSSIPSRCCWCRCYSLVWCTMQRRAMKCTGAPSGARHLRHNGRANSLVAKPIQSGGITRLVEGRRERNVGHAGALEQGNL